MELLIVVLLVFGLVFFVIGAFGVPTGRFNPIGGGLACWILTVLIGAWPG